MRLQPTNLAHYWRRIARHKRHHQPQKGTKSTKGFMKEVRTRISSKKVLCFLCLFVADDAFPEFARCGAGGDTKGFRKVAAT